MKRVWNTLAAVLILSLGLVSTANATLINLDLAVETADGMSYVSYEIETHQVVNNESELLNYQWNNNNTDILSIDYQFANGGTAWYDLSDSRVGGQFTDGYHFNFDSLTNMTYFTMDSLVVFSDYSDPTNPVAYHTNFMFNPTYIRSSYFVLESIDDYSWENSFSTISIIGVTGTIGLAGDSSPVPAPATLALFLLGLGAMGYISRRREETSVNA